MAELVSTPTGPALKRRRTPPAWAPPLWFLLLAAFALANLLRSWNAPILDRHEFRQLQTALSAHWMHEQGWSLAYPLPVFGPPWSVPMEFPLYQAAVASVSRLTGCGIEPAGRAVSIAAFFALLPALAGLLAAAGFSRTARWPVLAAVLLTPVYMFYSRTVLIESTALALAAWFLLAYVRGLDTASTSKSGLRPDFRHSPMSAVDAATPAQTKGTGRRPVRLGWDWILAACALGALAAMVKITTFAVFCAPAAGWALVALWRNWRRSSATSLGRVIAASLLPATVSIGAGLWWVHFGDAVKMSNPLAVHLSSENLQAWNFGSLAQRLNPALWLGLLRQTNNSVCDLLPALVALPALFLVARPYRLAALLCLGAFLVGPLLFFNLYVVHDYYFYANALFLSGAVGLLVAGLFAHPRLPRAVKALAALACLAGQLLAYERSLGSYHRRTPAQPPALAAAVRAVVPADAVVLVANWGWNPLLPYTMQRRAIMTPDGCLNDVGALAEVAGRLPRGAIQAFVWHGGGPMPLELHELVFRDLGLDPASVASSPDAALFVVPALRAAAADELATLAPAGVSLAPSFLAASPAEAEFKTFPAPLGTVSAICSPAPVSARSLYGVSAALNGSRPCIVAHAPSQLTIAPPAGARLIEIVYGLADESIDPAHQTDGVDVAIFTRGPGELRRILFRRSLDPVRNVADRGEQRAQLELPAGEATPLIFEASIGPAGNLAFDWFYWYRIEVR